MGKFMNNIELLAPAGSYESLVAAVQAGADAVYLGGTAFGARRSAANFNQEQLKMAIQYCHERSVAVYVTVNTLIKDEEFEDLKEYLDFLYISNVDGIIVQDVGVMAYVINHYPDMECHASTQMTLHNYWDMCWAEKSGLDRVVLARELELKEMKELREKSHLPIEVFVHGALCIAYSGNCLMSSYIGGRSGNRGACAQPCRKAYDLIQLDSGELHTSKEGIYLLSPKDIQAKELIPNLKALEPISLKIEGRMKGPDYVYTVVKAYRNAVDEKVDDLDMYKVFNRDFSQTYFKGKNYGELMNLSIPSQYGYLTAEAINCDQKMLTLKLYETLSKGDEIQCRYRTSTLGTRCDEIYLNGKKVIQAQAGSLVQVPFKHKVSKGMKFYKTYDAVHIRWAENESQKEVPRYPISLRFEAKLNKPAKLIASLNAFEVTVLSEILVDTAQKVALDQEKVLKQLSKLGGTPFYLEQYEMDIEEQVNIPLGEINALRRKACDMLLEMTVASYGTRERTCTNPIENEITQEQQEAYFLTFNDIENLKEAMDKCVERKGYVFILENWDQYVNHLSLMVEKGVYLGLPKIIRNNQVDEVERFMRKSGCLLPGIALSHIGQLSVLTFIPNVPWIANESMLCFNSATYAYLQQKGAQSVFASVEWSVKNQPSALGTLIYGRLPLMQTEYCPVGKVLHNKHQCGACLKGRYGLKDAQGNIYPLECDAKTCRVQVYSDKILYLLDHVKNLKKQGKKQFKVDFKNASKIEIEQVLCALLDNNQGGVYKPTIHTRGRLIDGIE